MRILYSLLFFLTVVTCLPACGQKSFDEKIQSLYRNTVPIITSADLLSLQEKGIYILDTRSQPEYRVSHIKGARFLDYELFDPENIRDIPKDAEVVLYCSVGYRSERIGEKMLEMGYGNVRNLYGGIFDWKNQGNQVINIHNQPTDSVHTYNQNWSQWLYKGVKIYE